MQFFFDIALIKIEGTLCSPIYLNYSVFDVFIDLNFIIYKSKDLLHPSHKAFMNKLIFGFQ